MSTLDTLTSISIISIAVQVFILMLVPAVLFFFGIRGIMVVQQQVRTYGPQVRGVFRQAAQIADDTSQKVVAPLIEVKANTARVGRMRAALAALFAGKGVRS